MKHAKIQYNTKDNIADTLYIPLLMKRNESNRRKPFFRDPFACEMVNKIDYNFSKYKKALRSSVGVAVRAKYFDEVTANFIQKHKNPIVVIIGCGLDARYQRLGKEITGKAIFYELDLPEVIELREKLLPIFENDIYLKYSMFETGWMDKLNDKHPQAAFLFVVEGVFIYFKKEQVKNVFVNLSKRFSTSKILFDVRSSWLCKHSPVHDPEITKSPFKLALDDDKEIENWAKNLKLESVQHYGDFKEWKRSGFIKYWLIRLFLQ